MIDKRLLGVVPGSKKYIAGSVAFQWCGMVANAALIFALGWLLESMLTGGDLKQAAWVTAAVGAAALAVRFVCARLTARMNHLAARQVKGELRRLIFEKLFRLGPSYRQQVSTAQVVQVAVEGVDQLETYFGAYLPQFFYSMLAPVTLFAMLCGVSVRCAVVLLVCVPLIPVSIALVQTFAKKLLGKYWGRYTSLGDTFLENLQGLTTLKIYGADEARQQAMAQQAEEFRKVTMRVLTMQLNSIVIMDLIAYGGAALGVILSVGELAAGRISPAGCFAVVLLSAEFFLPMRQLGSFFHVAMNGMAAAGKIFQLLDLEEPARGREPVRGDRGVVCRGLTFSYDGHRQVLQGVDLDLAPGTLTAVVGESGCGKSTLAAILMGRCRGYGGSVSLGDVELSQGEPEALAACCTYVGHRAHLFKGTVRDNLLLAAPQAGDEDMWRVLEQVKLAPFLREEAGLDTPLTEGAGNLSGGQRQRLALARALLRNSPIYIFDEATSNIDVESENDIMEQICALAGRHTVLVISHRLASVTGADMIYVMDGGRVAQKNTHAGLLAQGGLYRRLWEGQRELEQYQKQVI